MRVYRPIRDKIIVKIKVGELKSSGGIILEVSEREQTAREEGIIVSMGSRIFADTKGISEDIKEGDLVAFARYAGKSLGKEGEYEFRAIRDIDVICIIEEHTEEAMKCQI